MFIADQELSTEFNKKCEFVKASVKQFNEASFESVDEESKCLDIIQSNSRQLFEIAIAQNQLRTLLFDFIENPFDFLAFYDDAVSRDTFLFPCLSECACPNSDNFNRFKNQRRTKIEDQVLSFTELNFKKDEPLHYMGFGGGELLQDYIILIKLIRSGYNNILVSLIDPHHNRYKITGHSHTTFDNYKKIISGMSDEHRPADVVVEPSPSVQQFSTLKLLAMEMGIKLSIDIYCEIEEFKHEKHSAPNVITAVDFDDFTRESFADLVSTQQVLHQNGRMFLSSKMEDYIFTRESCTRFVDGKPPSSEVSDVDQDYFEFCKGIISPGQTQVKIANLVTFQYYGWIYNVFIPLINQNPQLQSVDLTLIQPQQTNYTGDWIGWEKPNTSITEYNLGYYIQLLLPHSVKLNLKLVTGYDYLDDFLEQVSGDMDFVSFRGRVLENGGVKAAMDEVRKMHAHFPKSKIYFGIMAANIARGKQPTCEFGAEWAWNGTVPSVSELNSEQEYIGVVNGFYENIHQSTTNLKHASDSPIMAASNAHSRLVKLITPIIKQLILKNPDSPFKLFLESVQNRNYSQALRRACTTKSQNAFKLIKILLQFKAELRIDINERSGDKKRSALHHAAISGTYEMYCFLVEEGGHTKIIDADKKTPQYYAEKNFKELDVLEQLLSENNQ